MGVGAGECEDQGSMGTSDGARTGERKRMTPDTKPEQKPNRAALPEMHTGKAWGSSFYILALFGLLAVGLIGFLIWNLQRDTITDETQPVETTAVESVSAAAPTTTTAPATTTTEEAYAGPADEVWRFNDELPEYITEPKGYPTGSTEGDVEVAFVNARIAATRAFADPSIEEPQVVRWKTGFSLKATRDLQAILLEKEWRTVPGELSQIEIESITIIDGQAAQVRACLLEEATTYALNDPDNFASRVRTQHFVVEVIKNPDGWQESELVEMIDDFEGVGTCVDMEVVNLGDGAEIGDSE